jgi:hypothetical protein
MMMRQRCNLQRSRSTHWKLDESGILSGFNDHGRRHPKISTAQRCLYRHLPDAGRAEQNLIIGIFQHGMKFRAQSLRLNKRPKQNVRIKQQTHLPALERINDVIRKRSIEIRGNSSYARQNTQTALRPIVWGRERHELGDGFACLRNDDLLAGCSLVYEPGKVRLGSMKIDGPHKVFSKGTNLVHLKA